MRQFIRDCLTMSQRSIRHTFRNADSLIASIALPVAIMLLFVIIFGGAISTGTSYVNYIVPGVILTCISFGSSNTAVIVARDMNGGLFNRFRSLPMSLSSVAVGHVMGSVARNSMAMVLVYIVALLLGFRPTASPPEWVSVIGLLLLVIMAINWLTTVFGLLVKNVDAASGMSFGLMFLPYVSSAFVPLSTLPIWLQGFAQQQPLTPIIDTLRGLLVGGPTHSWVAAVVWPIGTIIVCHGLTVLLLKRKGAVRSD